MLNNIDKIIVQLSNLDEADMVLKKSLKLVEHYHASVEILYVHESPLFDVPDYFRSDGGEGVNKEKIKQEIKNKVEEIDPKREFAIFVQIDDTSDRVWALAREDSETLIITAYHDSITQKIIDKVSQPVLVLNSEVDSYQKLALVINTNDESIGCVSFVKSSFKKSDIHLLYDFRYVVDPSMELDLQNIQLIEQAQREAFEEIKQKSGLKGKFFVDGSFFGDDLIQYLQEKSFDIITLCSRGDDFFVSDTLVSELLDSVVCDILVLR